MRLQFGNLNFSGRGFSNDFSAAAEDHAAASAGYDAGPAAAAAQALAEPAALAPAASSSSAIDAFKAAGARGRSVSGSALSASAQTPAQPCRAALAASLSEGLQGSGCSWPPTKRQSGAQGPGQACASRS